MSKNQKKPVPAKAFILNSLLATLLFSLRRFEKDALYFLQDV
jgi:hypothetical protein